VVVLLPFSFCFVGCIVGSGFCCCCGGFIVWREELEGRMGKEEEGMPNTCVRGCCSSTHIPLAIPKTHFNITKEIARGAESVVYEARLEGKLVAAKKPKLSTSADLDRFHEELQILSKVEHPNVATLVGVRAYPPDYFFFYHLYENGNLGDALHEADWRPTLQQILTIAIQLGCSTANPKIPFLSQITTEGILIKFLCVQHFCKKTTIF
jgi:serine/threonine protein kinase